VITAAFSPEVLDEGANSTAIELDPETVIVLRAKEHLKPAQLPLEAVSTAIRGQLAKEHASAAAKTRADELIASLRDGKTPLGQAIDGQNWTVIAAATRAQEGIDPTVLQALFRMPKPAAKDKPTFNSVTLADGSLVIVRLDGVNEAAAPTDEEKAKYRRFLASRIGQQDFSAYRKQLEAEADIERF
jgi:peptidyl-prolyl cis-trans isomerase D